MILKNIFSFNIFDCHYRITMNCNISKSKLFERQRQCQKHILHVTRRYLMVNIISNKSGRKSKLILFESLQAINNILDIRSPVGLSCSSLVCFCFTELLSEYLNISIQIQVDEIKFKLALRLDWLPSSATNPVFLCYLTKSLESRDRFIPFTIMFESEFY